MKRLIAILTLLVIMLPALAQDKPDAEQEKSALLTYVEEQLSTPNRKISFWGIEGVLSSDANIERISIADREGVWLEINKASIVWTRTALLTGNLVVDKLAAESIEVKRRPLPDENAVPSVEASGFSVPELPVSVNLNELVIDSVTFGEGVFGLASELEIGGNLVIDTGKLETGLEIKRLDGPGGELDLDASFSSETNILDLDLSLFEPGDGVVANLLNFHEKPAVSLGLKGSGPVSDLRLALTLDADERRVMTGQARFAGTDESRRFDIGAAGPLGELVRPDLRDLFGQRSELILAGRTLDDGGFDIERLEIASGALELSGSLQTAADGFPVEFSLDGTIQSKNAAPVVLPLPGGVTEIGKASLDFRFGGGGVTTWSGRILATDFATAGLRAGEFQLNLAGAAVGLDDPNNREVTFVIDGEATGLGSDDPGISNAVGETIALDINGAWKSDQPVVVDRARIDAEALDLEFAGQINGGTLDGRYRVDVADAAVLSALVQRELAGAVKISADGLIEPVTGAFDLALNGEIQDVAVGSVIDGLLAGKTTISGGAARTETGIRAENLAVSNQQMSIRMNGLYGTETADLTFNSSVADLAVVSEKVAGRLEAQGSARGKDGIIDLQFDANMSEGAKVLGRSLTNAAIAFTGRNQKSGLSGGIDGAAFIGGERIDLKSQFAAGDSGRRLDGLVLNAGATKLSGTASMDEDGLIVSDLRLSSSDISTAAAILLVEATGKIEADIVLAIANKQQNGRVSGKLSSVRYADVELTDGDIDFTFSDLFGVPSADGSAALRQMMVAGIQIAKLDANASSSANTTKFDARADLQNGTAISTRGSIANQGDAALVTLTDAELSKGETLAKLKQSARLLIGADAIEIDSVELDVGDGSVSLNGAAGDQLALLLDIQSVSLDVANAVRPDLGLAGSVSGRAQVGGTSAEPDVNFDLKGSGITSTVLRLAGLPPIQVTASGRSDSNKMVVDARMNSGNGIQAAANGTVPLGDGALALNVALQSFPLEIVDRMAGRQGLGGRLSGDAKIEGSIDQPTAKFALNGTGIRATVLSNNGLGLLDASANGTYSGNTVNLTAFNVSGVSGLAVNGSGRIPLSGGGLNISLDGSAPLSIANRQLASRGARAEGLARFAIQLSGAIANPAINGTLSTQGASYSDPLANVALRNIAVSANLTGTRVVIRQGSANLAAGGSVSMAGSVSLDGSAGYPADLTVVLDNARYTDGTLVVATMSGRLGITGPLIYDPLIGGALNVSRAELTIPETIAGGADSLNVKHINPPKKVERTLEFARADDGTPVPSSRPSVARLNVSVNAPNKVFVRGRGLDAELGGSVRLTGPVTNIQPVGGFELIRGRLSILGKRIVFDEGKVTLVGDLDPFVRFVASSDADEATVFITVTGRVSDPSIVFSSDPELPQDEVLARLIFGRSISELSALQVAKLAASAAQLAGGGNSSLLDSFRQSTGLDELDVVTDSGGNAAVRAGRYINDNVYLGVEAGASGSTKGTINIDITDSLKATGATGSDGNSSIGIFFEKDY
ncbi:MAG: translocation/assembly module TamB domain-containing protein [Rhizobiaceae bacterium]